MRKISKKVLKISSIIGLLTTLSLGSIIPVCILHNSDNKSQLNSSNISPLSFGPQYIPASVLDSKATGGTFDLYIDNTITRAYDFNCTDLSFDNVSEDGTIQWDGKTYSININENGYYFVHFLIYKNRLKKNQKFKNFRSLTKYW